MLLRRLACLVLGASTVIGAFQLTAAAATNFDVTNNFTSAFVIGGENNPDLTLTRGTTYTFSLNASGHPFWLTTVRGAGDTEAHAFSSGVTGNGTDVGTVTFAVPASAPATLFYQCAFHDPMGGTLRIVSATTSVVPSMGHGALGALAAVLLLGAAVMLRRRMRA